MSGCFTNYGNLDKGLARINSVDQAISVFGPPAQITQRGDTEYLVWSSNRNVTIPTSGAFQGNIGGSDFYGTTSGGTATYNYAASVKMEAVDGVITRYWYDGNYGGLDHFVKRVEANGLHFSNPDNPSGKREISRDLDRELDQLLEDQKVD